MVNILTKLTSRISDLKNCVSDYVSIQGPFENAYDTICAMNNYESDFRENKRKLFIQYGGLSDCAEPYYNHKNETHPSFMVHPYVKKFVEYDNFNVGVKTYKISDPKETYSSFGNNISATISDFIDSSGYLVSAWNNPLNSNAEYVTQYEKSTNIDSTGALNEFIDFDGLFHPDALDMLFGSKGVNGVCDKLSSYLDINQKEIEFIKDQLNEFNSSIRCIAYANNDGSNDGSHDKPWDIYRYCSDKYGNKYILLKQYSSANSISALSAVSDIEKATTPGMLWIRKANHPIAFPAFAFDSSFNSISSQIEHTKMFETDYNSAFVEMQMLDISGTTGLSAPQIFDMMIDLDKSRLMMQTKLQSSAADSIVICEVKDQYDNTLAVKRNVLTFVRYGEREKYDISSDLTFKGFYSNAKTPMGFVCMKVDSLAKTVDMYAYELNEATKTFKQLSGSKTLTASIPDDVNEYCVSIDDDIICVGTMCGNDLTHKVVVNYFGVSSDYNDIDAYIPQYDKILLTFMFKVRYNDIVPINDIASNERKYTPSTNMGFMPLVERDLIIDEDDKVNELYKRPAAIRQFSDRGIVKFQLLGPSTDVSEAIDFKTFVAPRIYEGRTDSNDYIQKLSSNLSALSYAGMHMFQNNDIAKLMQQKKISTTDCVDPYGLVKFFAENKLNGVDVAFKHNEDNGNMHYTNDKYAMHPWILSGTIPDYYITPSSKQHGTKQSTNIAVFKLLENDTPISVEWYQHADRSIQLDFNKQYYNLQLNTNTSNDYNVNHEFLNLDKPGYAGYLRVFNANAANASTSEVALLSTDNAKYVTNVLYIKNISHDGIPMFILSAMNYEEISVTYYGLAIDGNKTSALGISALGIDSNTILAISSSVNSKSK